MGSSLAPPPIVLPLLGPFVPGLLAVLNRAAPARVRSGLAETAIRLWLRSADYPRPHPWGAALFRPDIASGEVFPRKQRAAVTPSFALGAPNVDPEFG